MRCSTANFTSLPLQQLLAAEDYVRPLPPREFQSCELLGPRQRVPRLQAVTSLSVVIPNNSAPSAVATGTPDVVVRRGIGYADSDSCTYTW